MKKLRGRTLIITVYVFGMLWVVNQVTDYKIFTAFDTVGKALQDFELTDYVFSNMRGDPGIDPRIVLVNIGVLSRREVAQQIRLINSHKPKVVAFDGFWNCEGGLRDSVNCPMLLDTLGNLMLSAAIDEADNFVLATKLMQTRLLAQTDNNDADSLEHSDSMFTDFAHEGFVTLPTTATYQEDVKICKSIFPYKQVGPKKELAWSVQIAMQFDSIKTGKFLARNSEEEFVNFRGNIDDHPDQSQGRIEGEQKILFYVVDADEMLRDEVLPGLFKDNIVMLGYLGDYLGDPSWDDKFFTPLNNVVAGRANPDMFGLVVHANAVAMILNEDYINQIPDWGEFAIAFLLCFLTVALFSWFDKKVPDWFDAFSVIVQLVELGLIAALKIYAFAIWSLKLDLTLAFGVAALVGPSYDIFKSVQNDIARRLTKRRERVLTP